MTRERFEEFCTHYSEMFQEGYSYEDMAHFLMNNVDGLIEIAERYFDSIYDE